MSIVLGEAYAFGVIWSFTFNSLAMLVLRFKYKGERGWKVPPNITIAGREIPLGLASVFLVLFSTAIVNLFTKSMATVAGSPLQPAFFLDLHRFRTSKPQETCAGATGNEGTFPVTPQ